MGTLKSTLAKLIETPLIVTQRYEGFLATNRNIQFSKPIGEFAKEQMTQPPKDRSAQFSPSGVAGCSRAQVFRFTNLPYVDKVNTDLANIFLTGHFLHMKWQSALLQAGIITRAEVPVRLHTQKITGSMDGMGIIPDTKIKAFPEIFDQIRWNDWVFTDQGMYRQDHSTKFFGLEVKSINSRGFGFVLRENAPKPEHIYQIHAYMYLSGLSVFSVVYENKDTGEWKEFLVPRDPKIIFDVSKKLLSMNQMVDINKLPDVLEPCTRKMGPYHNCPYRDSCLNTKSGDVKWLPDRFGSQEIGASKSKVISSDPSPFQTDLVK